MAASSGSRPVQHNVDLNLFNLTPELLDVPTLLCILESRCIQAPNMKLMTKDQLLGLFMRVVPLPQRRKLRGKNIAEEDDPLEVLHSNNCISIGFNKTAKSETCLHTSSKRLTPASDRLKPPPDVINYGRKKITLNRPSSSKSNGGKNLDNIIVKDRTKAQQKSAETSTSTGTKCLKMFSTQELDKIIINDRTKTCKKLSETSAGTRATCSKMDGSQDLDKIIITDRTKTQKRSYETLASTKVKCMKTESEESKVPNKISPKTSSRAEDKLPKVPSKRVKLKRPSFNLNAEAGKSESTSDVESKRQKVTQP